MPVFFLLGLLGVVICHVLKRKGYRCTTEPQDGEEETWRDGKDAELGEGEESFRCLSVKSPTIISRPLPAVLSKDGGFYAFTAAVGTSCEYTRHL